MARGRTADVYAWEGNNVLKLFHDWFKLEDIEYERRIADAVCASGVDAPAVTGLIQVAGRNGLIYERVDGQSMTTALLRKPWRVFDLARLLAELHVQMHKSRFASDVPSQREKIQAKIEHMKTSFALPKESLLKRLALLPDGDRVCHGDFHTGNVLLTSKGACTIDWMDATRGNPMADVARTSIILKGMAERQVPNAFIKGFVRLFHAAYLRQYFRLHPQGMEEYRLWLPIVAGARLSENIPELEMWLVKQADL
jgi:uncharacterized protein (TIGR02172 family)